MIIYKNLRYQIVIWVAVAIYKVNSQGVPYEEYGMSIGTTGLREKVSSYIYAYITSRLMSREYVLDKSPLT